MGHTGSLPSPITHTPLHAILLWGDPSPFPWKPERWTDALLAGSLTVLVPSACECEVTTVVVVLAAGFIHASASPTGSGFFFVKKKEKALRQCIDYQGLNDIKVKKRYPLPLISSAF